LPGIGGKEKKRRAQSVGELKKKKKNSQKKEGVPKSNEAKEGGQDAAETILKIPERGETM